MNKGGSRIRRDSAEKILAAVRHIALHKFTEERSTLQKVYVPKQLLADDKCQAMLVLDTYALAGKGTKQAMTLATLNAPVSLSLVTTLGLGEQHFIDACLVDERIMAKFSYAYAGLELNEQLVEASGDLLIDACVSLILKGELLAPAGKQIGSH